MEELAEITYIVIGIVSTMWLESLMVEQGYQDGYGLAFEFGDRLTYIILWPIFTLPSMVQFAVVFLQTLMYGDDQQ